MSPRLSHCYWVQPKKRFVIKKESMALFNWPVLWTFDHNAKPILAQRYDDHVAMFSYHRVIGKFTVKQAKYLFAYTRSTSPASEKSIAKHIPSDAWRIIADMRSAPNLSYFTIPT